MVWHSSAIMMWNSHISIEFSADFHVSLRINRSGCDLPAFKRCHTGSAVCVIGAGSCFYVCIVPTFKILSSLFKDYCPKHQSPLRSAVNSLLISHCWNVVQTQWLLIQAPLMQIPNTEWKSRISTDSKQNLSVHLVRLVSLSVCRNKLLRLIWSLDRWFMQSAFF